MASLAANGDHSLAGLRDAAIIATMSDAMLRVSEMCALLVEDVTVEPDGSGRLTIRTSKTDQEGEGAVQYLGALTVKRIRAKLDKGGFSIGPSVSPGTLGGHCREPSAYCFRAAACVETPGRRRRYRGSSVWPQTPGGIGPKSRLTRGYDSRVADRRPVVVDPEAGPLHPCTTGRPESRRPPQVWSLNTGAGGFQSRKGLGYTGAGMSGTRSRPESGARLR